MFEDRGHWSFFDLNPDEHREIARQYRLAKVSIRVWVGYETRHRVADIICLEDEPGRFVVVDRREPYIWVQRSKFKPEVVH